MTSKDSHDPGWNDPPIFTYDKATAIQAAAATKRTSLNKRVAFPINSSSGNQAKDVNSASPLINPPFKPPPMSPTPPKVSQPTAEVKASGETEVPSEDKLKMVLENLSIETNCDEDIVKRIKIMEKMWTDGKLDNVVQCRVYELSEALAKGDTEAADRIQMGLMVDYVSQCSTWMSGIRHLINQKKK